MTGTSLGRLQRVELREIWASEPADFTPWLAREENLSVLAEAVGLELELEAQERAVGPFRADILCKDIGTGDWVLVENQLERTDHTHLGQLLTYASGLEAVTIVWVAGRFTEEHRSTLDWLNKITDERFRFFGLEVELWRIGASPAAPKFNVVSKPNNWSRAVAEAARNIDDVGLSEVRASQLAYFQALNTVLEGKQGPVRGNRKPLPQAWIEYPIGRTNFKVAAAMLRPSRCIRAELYIAGVDAKGFFARLINDRRSLESELGFPLEWEELPERRDCRICVYLRDLDPLDRGDWPRQHEWLAEHLNSLHRVFRERVRSLTPDFTRTGVRDALGYPVNEEGVGDDTA
ncbi:MAG: DUF4268 domain-containing protein [Pikeienuella sp.]|uniref:DUF4268 domain-containing protein n=1 Tax=Pikeienuella sp. TaxID=2831957 RepID=UPI00391DF891